MYSVIHKMHQLNVLSCFIFSEKEDQFGGLSSTHCAWRHFRCYFTSIVKTIFHIRCTMHRRSLEKQFWKTPQRANKKMIEQQTMQSANQESQSKTFRPRKNGTRRCCRQRKRTDPPWKVLRRWQANITRRQPRMQERQGTLTSTPTR